jgi:hypothetical protein
MWSYTATPLYVSVMWYLIKHKNSITLIGNDNVEDARTFVLGTVLYAVDYDYYWLRVGRPGFDFRQDNLFLIFTASSFLSNESLGIFPPGEEG